MNAKLAPGTDFKLRLDKVLTDIVWSGEAVGVAGPEAAAIRAARQAVVARVRQEAGEIAEQVDQAWPGRPPASFTVVESFSDLLEGRALDVYRVPVPNTVQVVDVDGRIITPSVAAEAHLGPRDMRYVCAVPILQTLDVGFKALFGPDPSAVILQGERKVLRRIASVFTEGVRRGLFTTGVLHPAYKVPLAVVDARQRWIYGLAAMSLLSIDGINARFGFKAVAPEGALLEPWPDPLPWEEGGGR